MSYFTTNLHIAREILLAKMSYASKTGMERYTFPMYCTQYCGSIRWRLLESLLNYSVSFVQESEVKAPAPTRKGTTESSNALVTY